MEYIIDHLQRMDPLSIPRDLDDFIHSCTPFPCSRILQEDKKYYKNWIDMVRETTDHTIYSGTVRIRKMKDLRKQLEHLLNNDYRHYYGTVVVPTCTFDRYTNLQEWVSGKFEKRQHVNKLIESSDDLLASTVVSGCMDHIVNSDVDIMHTRSLNELFELYTRENSKLHV